MQFIDLVGSTALSTQLDPEELRAVIQAYRETCATVIRRFDGHLAKYIRDGLLVYFGYPVAHEDDAQRAVRVGLGIVGAMSDLPLPHVRLPHPLQVRIGIHTGLVVAGEMGVGDQPEPLGIVGETPNIAARLQEKAEPNSVVISPATYRLVIGLFECEELGLQRLKGISTPLVVYRVVRESAAQSRFDVALQAGLTPLVGREEELALLRLAGEVADGVHLHPFCTRRYQEEVVLPRVHEGLTSSGRSAEHFEVSGGGFIAPGPDDAAVANMFEWVRMRLGFYGSTPAYWPVLELHGLGDVGRKLNVLSKQGKWTEMTSAISDEVVHLFAAVGTHKEIITVIEQRFSGVSDAVFASINSTVRSDLPSDVLADIRRIPVRFKGYKTAW